MKGMIGGVLIFAMWFCGCTSVSEADSQPAVRAAVKSVSYARADGVDMQIFSLRSISHHRDWKTTALGAHRDQMNPGLEEKIASLKGKAYWEACYGVTEENILGGSYCYYLDSDSLSLLTALRMK